MKSFEKFQSRALNADALKEIKGGTLDPPAHCFIYSSYCASVFANCTYYCSGGDGYGTDWWNCVVSQSGESGPCSPLQGYTNLCYYTDCPE